MRKKQIKVEIVDGVAIEHTEAVDEYPINIKVRYGYGDDESVVVHSLRDVARAMYAKAEKVPVTLRGHFISGIEIKSVAPLQDSYSEEELKEIEMMVQAIGERVMVAVNTKDMSKLQEGALDQKLLLNETNHG